MNCSNFNMKVDIYPDTTINPDKLDEFYSKLKNLKGFENTYLEIDDDNNLININCDLDKLNEIYNVFYKPDKFAVELSEIIGNGFVKILFYDNFYYDNLGTWGYEITPHIVFILESRMERIDAIIRPFASGFFLEPILATR